MKFLKIYIVQVGSLWALLEGYTYFKDDTLKAGLGDFWVLLYIIPFFTTVAYVLLKGGSVDTTQSRQQIAATEGNFSPGVVEKNYSVKTKKTDPKKPNTRIKQEIDTLDEKPLIKTKGDYSPGHVGGDYKVE